LWEKVRLARFVRREDPHLSRKTPAKRASTKTASKRAVPKEQALLDRILKSLDDDKAEDIVTIGLEGRSSLTDALVIASGRSSRHVAAIAEHLARKLKEAGYGTRPIDGLQSGDWVLVDAGDVIVHIFRPEVRDYYDLEGMWSVEEPKRAAASQ
jgi:ribosome-associated protein